MSFQAIAPLQAKQIKITGWGTNAPTIAFNAPVSAGSTILFIGTLVRHDTAQACLINSASDTSANDYETPVNVRASGSYRPNVAMVYAENVAAGSPTITLTLNQGTAIRITGMLYEIEKCAASAVVDGLDTEELATAATSITVGPTDTLDQTDQMVIVAAGGWFGVPQTPGGWTSGIAHQNGLDSFVGAMVAHKTIATTAAQSATVVHESSINSAALIVTLKAAAAASGLRYKFDLHPTLADSMTALYVEVWRNGEPNEVLAEVYTGQTTDATGELLIQTGVNGATLPVSVAGTDTIKADVRDLSGNGTGRISGTVETF
jgi:hypothetical protein